jgi:hypothetical protein
VLSKFFWADRAARFEQRDFQSRFRALFGGPAASGAGTDDDHIVRLFERILDARPGDKLKDGE